MNPYLAAALVAIAGFVIAATIVVLALAAYRFRGQRETIRQAHGQAVQQVEQGAAARRQAEIEFNNLKQVVEQFQAKPIFAQLTQQQIQFIIQSITEAVASQYKAPQSLN